MVFCNKIKRIYLYCKEYGFNCYISSLPYNLYFRLRESVPIGKGAKLLFCKHDAIINYLYIHYYSMIDDYLMVNKKEEKDYRNCIWTAWLQGEELAPEVIKMNLASMRKHSNGHKLIVLTNKNIFQYIDVPYKIKKKHDNGIIGDAHFSDVVRMMVLAQYGGVWLDATMFLHEPMDEVAFSSPFYSIGVNKQYSRYVSDNKWKVCILGGSDNSKYLKLISSILNSYWSDHFLPIDYFVFDYIIAMIYRNDFQFKQIVDLLPRMSFNSTELKKIINYNLDEKSLSDLFVKNQIYYLSYRNTYIKYNDSKEQTNYGYLYNCLMNDEENF